MAESLAHVMAKFIAGYRIHNIPSGVTEFARLHFADAIGIGMGASSCAPYNDIVNSLTVKSQSDDGAMVFGQKNLVPADTAALLNGMLIHSMEYDDTHMASVVHGSAVIAPTVLALANTEGLSLNETLRLYILGWELLIRLGLSSPGQFQKNGFQITSVGGALVAAAISSVAMRLDLDKVVNAIGIAGSQSSGIFEFLSNGSNVKAMHPGWAAHAGIWAAQLAALGLDGPESVIEGRFGVYKVFARDDLASKRLSDSFLSLGNEWLILQAAFKQYPCCHYIHPYLEAASLIRTKIDSIASIQEINCYVADGASDIICEPWTEKQQPKNINDIKYSLPYCLAIALLGKPIDLDTVTTKEINKDALLLANKMNWHLWKESFFPKKFDAKIVVNLRTNEEVAVHIDQVLGTSERPLEKQQVKAKFLRNAGMVLDRDRAHQLWDSLITGESIGEICTMLRCL